MKIAFSQAASRRISGSNPPDSDCRGGAQPFDDPYRAQLQIIAVQGFPLVWKGCAQAEHRMYRHS
jgi:hypothetical protein